MTLNFRRKSVMTVGEFTSSHHCKSPQLSRVEQLTRSYNDSCTFIILDFVMASSSKIHWRDMLSMLSALQ